MLWDKLVLESICCDDVTKVKIRSQTLSPNLHSKP